MGTVTAMPLKKSYNKIDAGSCNPAIIHCDADGDLTITWQDDSTTTESFVAGEDRSAGNVKLATIASGTFSFDF